MWRTCGAAVTPIFLVTVCISWRALTKTCSNSKTHYTISHQCVTTQSVEVYVWYVVWDVGCGWMCVCIQYINNMRLATIYIGILRHARYPSPNSPYPINFICTQGICHWQDGKTRAHTQSHKNPNKCTNYDLHGILSHRYSIRYLRYIVMSRKPCAVLFQRTAKTMRHVNIFNWITFRKENTEKLGQTNSSLRTIQTQKNEKICGGMQSSRPWLVRENCSRVENSTAKITQLLWGWKVVVGSRRRESQNGWRCVLVYVLIDLIYFHDRMRFFSQETHLWRPIFNIAPQVLENDAERAARV